MKKDKFSPEFLQKVKDSISILEVVGEHVVLRKAGANHIGLCPFHSERTPSFSVNESKQLYHCYGCQKGGDLVSFVMETLSLSFPEAVEELCDRAKVALPSGWKGTDPETEGGDKKAAAQREKQALAFKLNRFVAAYFHQNLSREKSAWDYVSSRGVPQEAIQTFYMGAASSSWDALSHHLAAKKAPLELARELGLIRLSQNEKTRPNQSDHFDLFRNRVVFPILNLRGKVAAFGGRILGDETPKYLNSPESFIYQKSKLAFGLYQAQKYIREQDEIILVEGYFDVLGLWAAGFKNVVATCGTALTEDHLNVFRRLASRVIVLFDGDRAGIAATNKAMETGLDLGMILFGATLPEGLDPDEFILKSGPHSGKAQMQFILSQSQPLLDSKLEEQLLLAEKSPEDRTQALKQIGSWLGRFQDSIGREVRLQWVQERLGVSRQILQEAMGKNASTGVQKSEKKGPPKIQVNQNSVLPTLTLLDRALLEGIVSGIEYQKIFLSAQDRLSIDAPLEDLLEFLPARQFVHLFLKKLGSLASLGAGFGPFDESAWGGLLGEVSNEPLRAILTEALLREKPKLTPEEFQRVVSKSLTRRWARFSQQIKTDIENAGRKKDEGLRSKLLKDYLDVQRKMKEFISFYDEE